MRKLSARRFTVPTTYRRRRRRIAKTIATWRSPGEKLKAIGRRQLVQTESILLG